MSAATSSRLIRDLVEAGIGVLRDLRREDVKQQAHDKAEERVLDALVGASAGSATRDSFRKKLRAGELDDREIEIELSGQPSGGMFDIPGMPGANVINIQEMIGKAMGGKPAKRKVKVKDSHALLMADEADKLLDQDQLTREAVELTENHGIVFIDEIDKVASGGAYSGPSREGGPARSAAADRRHDRVDQIRPGENRPHFVHRLGRVPCEQAVGPAA